MGEVNHRRPIDCLRRAQIDGRALNSAQHRISKLFDSTNCTDVLLPVGRPAGHDSSVHKLNPERKDQYDLRGILPVGMVLMCICMHARQNAPIQCVREVFVLSLPVDDLRPGVLCDATC